MTSSLPRRAFLGVALPAEHAFDDDHGIRVAGVAPASMAEDAGVRVGDRLSRIDGRALTTTSELRQAVRAAGARPTATLTFSRDGQTYERQVAVRHHPVEMIGDAPTVAGHVDSLGARLRTWTTTTRRTDPRPAVLVVQGIGLESVERTDGTPLGVLLRACATRNWVTMRVEKPGVGDSEGPTQPTFAAELAGFRAGLAALQAMPTVDSTATFVFGHSVGALVAAELAREEGCHIRGIIAYGAPSSRWWDAIEATTRRQLRDRGLDSAAVEARVLAERAKPSTRTAAYHDELDAIDTERLWREMRARALVLQGEHDWVVGRDAGAEIVGLINAGGRASAELVVLPGLDHAMTRHATTASSVTAYGAGALDAGHAAVTCSWAERILDA